MLDIGLLRGPEKKAVTQNLLRKEPSLDVANIIALDESVRRLQTDLDSMRSQRNDLAKQAGNTGVSDAIREQSAELGAKIKTITAELEEIQGTCKKAILCCPNPLDADVPDGGKESNKPVRSWGDKQEFSFTPKNHVELNKKLGWVDFERATKMSGSGFALYRGDAVKVMYALIRLMLKNNAQHGFTPVMVPALVNDDAMTKNGSLPKFEGDFYQTEGENLSLIPTAEVPLTNLHAGEVIKEDDLPIRYTAWTNCFRREAGGYGATERGLIRIHQFEKVELYALSHPDKSRDELESMVTVAEKLLQTLGLHYRVSLLAAQDTSFVSARTYDLEVWLPGQDQFYEVSSCSNATDFQARRAKIKYAAKDGGKKHFIHTLNGSSLALPRLVVALMETYQQEDGSILLPDVLQREMDNLW